MNRAHPDAEALCCSDMWRDIMSVDYVVMAEFINWLCSVTSIFDYSHTSGIKVGLRDDVADRYGIPFLCRAAISDSLSLTFSLLIRN